MEFNYEEDIAFDPGQLDEEWVKHPGIFFQYQRALTDAEKNVKEVWEIKKVKRAELVQQAKIQGAKNDAEREAFFRDHPEYKTATMDLINAEYERDMIQNAITSLYRKEKSMEQAVALLKMEYWMGPKEPHVLKEGKRIPSFSNQAKAKTERQRRSRKRS